MSDTYSVLDQESDVCYVQMWTVVGGVAQLPGQILGRTTWTELLELVTAHGGRRKAYDLFEALDTNGVMRRYRATESAVTW